MRAKDVMEHIKSFLSPDETLKEAVNKMRVYRRGESGVGVKGIIVLDRDENLVGLLSIKDILKAIIPFYMGMTDLDMFTWDGMLEQMTKKAADKKVGDIMTKKVITVPEEAPLMECADFLVRYNLQRLPVVNKEKKVVGIVYVRDLYYALIKTLFEEEVS